EEGNCPFQNHTSFHYNVYLGPLWMHLLTTSWKLTWADMSSKRRELRQFEVVRSRFGKFRVCDTITRLACERIINLLPQFLFCNGALVCFPPRPRLWIMTGCGLTANFMNRSAAWAAVCRPSGLSQAIVWHSLR